MISSEYKKEGEMKEVLSCCLYFTASKLSRVLTKMAEDEFKPLGISPTYAFLLKVVNEHPGSGTCQIAEELEIAPSTITRFVDKLESKGLLVRVFEGRCAQITLTEEGKAMIGQVDQVWEKLYHRYVDILGEDEAKHMTKEINSMANKLLNE